MTAQDYESLISHRMIFVSVCGDFCHKVLERRDLRRSHTALVILEELPRGIFYNLLLQDDIRIKSGKVIRTP